jgi:hypothetical protein
MTEQLSPAEKRAEGYRQRLRELGSAATTGELLEAADAVGKVANRVNDSNKSFLARVRGMIGQISRPESNPG